MRFALLACILFLLAACERESGAPGNAEQQANTARPPMPELEPPVATGREREDGGDAAAMLRRYYAAIEAGDYDSALAMRSGETGAEDRQRFADNFKVYQSYQADVGTPSEAVEAGGWAYVEVPVMIRGIFRGGKPFASAGSVTVRRSTSAGGEGRWQVYIGERRPAR